MRAWKQFYSERQILRGKDISIWCSSMDWICLKCDTRVSENTLLRLNCISATHCHHINSTGTTNNNSTHKKKEAPLIATALNTIKYASELSLIIILFSSMSRVERILVLISHVFNMNIKMKWSNLDVKIYNTLGAFSISHSGEERRVNERVEREGSGIEEAGRWLINKIAEAKAHSNNGNIVQIMQTKVAEIKNYR